MVHFFREQDINFGDSALDTVYLIQGEDEAGIKALLSHADTKHALVEIQRRRPKMMSVPGSITVLDDRVQYVEGPYRGDATEVRYDAEQDSAGVVKRLGSV